MVHAKSLSVSEYCSVGGSAIGERRLIPNKRQKYTSNKLTKIETRIRTKIRRGNVSMINERSKTPGVWCIVGRAKGRQASDKTQNSPVAVRRPKRLGALVNRPGITNTMQSDR